jgi:hypothetical protein
VRCLILACGVGVPMLKSISHSPTYTLCMGESPVRVKVNIWGWLAGWLTDLQHWVFHYLLITLPDLGS